MVGKVYSATLLGLEGQIIQIEADTSKTFRSFEIVGLAGKAVQESKHRVASAIRNSGFWFPGRQITVSLAPADIPKSGPLFDLPIALGIMLATGDLELDTKKRLFLGELSLEGDLRPIPGVLPLTDSAKKHGFKEIFLPIENVEEARIIKGIKIYGLEKITDLYSIERLKKKSLSQERIKIKSVSRETDLDISEVKGQAVAKRALEIAAAGGHNLLMSGSPGSGKSMLAKRLPGILPDMTTEEKLEVTKVYSAANLLSKGSSLIDQRPVRSPHHTISQIALVGGGSSPKPGEISLSHRGVLFLDEFTEFTNQSLEVLRQPLEDRVVSIARASGSVTYPSNFMLVAAMNPCKCGWLGDPDRECTCTPRDIDRYSKKISGPVMDRIDLQVNVRKVDFDSLTSTRREESSESVKGRVQVARDIQLERFKDSEVKSNSEMSQKQIGEYIKIDKSSYSLLENAVEKMNLSARSYFRILKVARTIGDLAQEAKVSKAHIAEALGYRLAIGR
ncbi:MAG TPA: ATP-binding protein [bacterium]|nr:ATP-binding protein [bacterium]